MKPDQFETVIKKLTATLFALDLKGVKSGINIKIYSSDTSFTIVIEGS